jgi:hypothetical protein
MTGQPLRLPLGLSDFRILREEGRYFADKSPLIDRVVESDAPVLLVPRPRRFGKTLALSMLRCFFEKSPEDRTALFAGLAVASSSVARPHFQRHPVVFVTLKDVKPTTWEQCFDGIAGVLATLYGEHRDLLASDGLEADEAEVFTSILERRATPAVCVQALLFLSRLLEQHHRERVVILVDEYDSPIHAGYAHGYYDDVVAFFRDFLSAAFKDNPHLYRGVLTGILRVAKESLFSGLNNVDVHGILRPELAPFFGFTEPEVRALVEAAGQPQLIDGIRSFYNGYLFGGLAIYNPWSVLSYLSRAEKELLPYWIDTSDNVLVRKLLVDGPDGIRAELEALLAGGTIDKRIDENVVLRDLSPRSDAVWSFLLFTGYLKAVHVELVEGERWAKLAVPNAEVAVALRRMAQDWLAAQVGGSAELDRFLAALLRGDAAVVERHLAHLVKVNLSYFDPASPEPERFYHGLVVGLLAGLGSRYEVRSNRESGFGRCDVMVLPKAAGQPGVVLELKRVDGERGETKDKALAAALRQIRKRDYAAELRERGASPIHEMAAVFDGKRAYVRAAGEPETTPSKPRGATKRRAPRRARRPGRS